MSEITPDTVGLNPDDAGAVILKFYVDNAENPAELRTSYDEVVRTRHIDFDSVSKPAMTGVVDAVYRKLAGFGLLLCNDGDERIAGFNWASQHAKDSDNYGPGRFEIARLPERLFFASYARLLSAFDTNSASYLRLLPQSELVERALPEEVVEAVNPFAASHVTGRVSTKFSSWGEFRVTQPASPYWGCYMRIGTYGQHGAELVDPGRAVTVRIPTGRLANQAIFDSGRYGHLGRGGWLPLKESGYVPDDIGVQSVFSNAPSKDITQLDTKDHFVEAFLKAARMM